MSKDIVVLASFNGVVAGLTLLDFVVEPSVKLFFSLLAWLGSTWYWAVRGGFKA